MCADKKKRTWAAALGFFSGFFFGGDRLGGGRGGVGHVNRGGGLRDRGSGGGDVARWRGARGGAGVRGGCRGIAASYAPGQADEGLHGAGLREEGALAVGKFQRRAEEDLWGMVQLRVDLVEIVLDVLIGVDLFDHRGRGGWRPDWVMIRKS
jgi:hypothetical protein